MADGPKIVDLVHPSSFKPLVDPLGQLQQKHDAQIGRVSNLVDLVADMEKRLTLVEQAIARLTTSSKQGVEGTDPAPRETSEKPKAESKPESESGQKQQKQESKESPRP